MGMEFFRPEIVLFGDSITQVSFSEGGWGARLADEYQRHADVTVRGYSGYNTKWALPLLPLVFPPESPRTPALVTVFFGANDAVRPAPIPGRTAGVSRQHVPLPEFRDNLKAIVGAIRACGDGTARVLLITPPPVDVIAWHKTERAKAEAAGFPIGPDGESSRDNAVTAQYRRRPLTRTRLGQVDEVGEVGEVGEVETQGGLQRGGRFLSDTGTHRPYARWAWRWARR